MKKKRNPSKHVFILANKTTSSTLFYLFFVFNEKNRAHIDIYYNFYSTFATSKQAKNKGIMKPIYSNLTCKMLALTLCSIMLAFLSIGCEHDVYNPNNGKDDEKTPNSFDFSTTSSIQVNVKYDVPEGYKVLFEIYLEDPFTIDKDGQIIKRTDLEPVIRRMTDGNGAYSGKEIINSDHGDEAYIYTSYIGVPTLFKTVIAGDAITADIKWDSTDDNPQTRAEGWQAPKGYHVLGTWSSKGYPHYLDTDNKITIPGDVLTIINTTLKEGGTCPKQYRQAIDFEINDPEGRNAEVSIRIIGGTSGAASAFGYYCYRADASLSEIKKAPTSFNGQGLDTDLSKATVNVFLSALDVTERNTKTATYKIKNTFKTPLSHETLGIPPYNPFIMVHDELKESRIEVHLVNYPPTEKADMALFHTEEDLSSVPTSYYVANGNYPFAIHLSGATNFNTPETQPIDKSFEHFMDWVNSNGTDYKDWYK